MRIFASYQGAGMRIYMWLDSRSLPYITYITYILITIYYPFLTTKPLTSFLDTIHSSLLFGLTCFLPITCKFTTSYCCGLIGFLPLNFPTVFTYRFFATKLDSKPLNRKFKSSYCCGLTSFLPLNCTAGLLQPWMDHPTQVIPPNTKN